MPNISIVDNEYITVEYLPDKKIIYHTVHQPVSGQTLRDALNAGTDALRKYGAHKWLSDDRKNGPQSPEDIEWGMNNWDRRTIEAGWKYWADVIPEFVVAAGSLMPLIDALGNLGVRMVLFTKLEDAFAWLDQIND